VRIALGAPTSAVRRMIVTRAMALALAGVGVGLVGALAGSTVLASLLFEVPATDPATYVAVTCVLALTALLASWIPALRASRVSPATALRSE